MCANQLRLYFSVIAGILVNIVRRIGPRGTARTDTIRPRLFKLAGRIKVTIRKAWLSFASPFPLQNLFIQAPDNQRAVPMRAPPG